MLHQRLSRLPRDVKRLPKIVRLRWPMLSQTRQHQASALGFDDQGHGARLLRLGAILRVSRTQGGQFVVYPSPGLARLANETLLSQGRYVLRRIRDRHSEVSGNERGCG